MRRCPMAAASPGPRCGTIPAPSPHCPATAPPPPGPGLRIPGSAPTRAGDTFQNNSGAALTMDMAAQPIITTPTVTGNGTDAAVLDGGSISGHELWNNPGLFYRLAGDVTVPAGA